LMEARAPGWGRRVGLQDTGLAPASSNPDRGAR
jgi:hypothetical protein